MRTPLGSREVAGQGGGSYIRKPVAEARVALQEIVHLFGGRRPARFGADDVNEEIRLAVLLFEHLQFLDAVMKEVVLVANVDGLRALRVRPGMYGDGKWHLYDIKKDPGETRPLEGEQPARLQKMIAIYERYAKEKGLEPVADDWNPWRSM